MKLISRFWLRLLGWKIEGEYSPGRLVMVGAPHTSNWDFLYGRLGMYAFGFRVRYLIKKEWFVWPLSLFFKATGGVPVDRSKTSRFTDKLQEYLKKHDNLALAFPVEGTRSRVERWKTGFFHVAMATKLPVILAYLDYQRKVIGVNVPYYLTGDLEKDLLKMEEFYANITPCIPENFNRQFFIREKKDPETPTQ